MVEYQQEETASVALFPFHHLNPINANKSTEWGTPDSQLPQKKKRTILGYTSMGAQLFHLFIPQHSREMETDARAIRLTNEKTDMKFLISCRGK